MQLLTIEQLSEQLNVPKSWIYTRTRKKEIPFRKLGRYVRFDVNEIQDWLDGKKGGEKWGVGKDERPNKIKKLDNTD